MNSIRESLQDGARAAAGAPDAIASVPLEPAVSWLVQWLRLGVEFIGAMIVAIGVLVAVWAFFRTLLAGRHGDFPRVRLILAHYLVVALEFQLAADILSTAIAPTWEQIGKLGMIAVIRTALNFFLMREMRQEEFPSPSRPSG